MPPSSKLILVHRKNHAVIRLKLAESRDGTWTRKGDEFHFGYKLHSKVDIDYALIREIDTTTAKVHHSMVDLSVPGEVVLRDKGYFGVPARGEDFTMKRRTTERPLDDLEKEWNRLISKLRSPGERPFAVIKRIFGAGRVLVTTLKRVQSVSVTYTKKGACNLRIADAI